MTNESYKPDSKDAKSETSSDSDKGASITPPKHEDETVHDIDNNISTAGGEAWAANDTGRGPDGTSPRCLFFFYSDSVLLQYPARPFLVPKF